MSVITKRYLTSAEVYHTQECVNCRRIKDQREMSESKAKQLGLSHCQHCSDESIPQERRRKSLRYQIARGEIDV